MEMNLNMNAVNQVLKSTVIYEENRPVNSISLILKGRVLIQANGLRTIVGSGSFLGVCDLYSGTYGVTYTAYDNLVLYVFPVEHKDSIDLILNANKDYGGLMVASLSRYMKEIESVHTALVQGAQQLFSSLDNCYKIYQELGRQSGFSAMSVSGLEELESLDMEFIVDPKKLEYYRACVGVPIEIQKSFYGNSSTICLYHIEEQADIISGLIGECTEISCYIFELSDGLINDTPDCLFRVIAKLAMDLGRAGFTNKKLVDLLDNVIDTINMVETLFEEKVGRSLPVDRVSMEKTYYELLSGTGEQPENENAEITDTEISDSEIKGVLKNSLVQILSFSGLEQEKCDLFKKLIDSFCGLLDKNSVDDTVRKLRKQISDLYYDIYEAVFLKAYKNEESSKTIDLFLQYGYLDERLLSKERLRELYLLKEINDGTGPCVVYNIREWLTLIYEGKKEPSKSEFDMDYYEMVRSMKRSNQIRDEEEKEYLESPLKKLQYEIQNVFKYNNRVTSGQISIFVPMLYEDNFVGSVERVHLTADKINAAVRRLMQIDFSIFTRESLYVNEAKKIKKEYIIQEVFPDIILFPNRGTNGVMWQDITGRKRNTSARFLLPIFLETEIESTLIKVFGRFRWEFCRTVQGTAWNNIQYKSLTSEYSDYIQFYRKNRELSEDKKEKLKLQIQRNRGNTREVFANDYEVWIKNESQGAVRLNKPVREMMATYCPYAKPLRDKLIAQPLFEEAMARFYRERNIKMKELDLRYRALQKDNIELTPELINTQKYYTES